MEKFIFAKRVTWVATVLLAMSLVITISVRALTNIDKNNDANYVARVTSQTFVDKIEAPADKAQRFLEAFAVIEPHKMCMLLDENARLWASSDRDELAFGANGERPGIDMTDAGNRPHSATNPIKKLVSLSKTDKSTSEIIYIDGKTYVSHAVALSGGMVLVCAVMI